MKALPLNENDFFAALEEMREWGIIGFYRSILADDPWPLPVGKAIRNLYERMEIFTPPGRCLLPFEPVTHFWNTLSPDPIHEHAQFFSLNHNGGLGAKGNIVALKKELFPQYAGLLDWLWKDTASYLPHFGGYTHSNPDIRRVVDEGFAVMVEELENELAEIRSEGENADPEELNLLLALKEYSEGVKVFYRNSLEAIRTAAEEREELKIIAEAFENCFMKPSASFLSGLLAVNMTWMLDFCDSIGRVDQALGDLFEADLERGRIDLEFTRRLLDEWFKNFERHNAWNMQIGGYTPDGKDGCNKLTREILFATERNNLIRPNVAFRITGSTPDDYVIDALKAVRNGTGRPALYNDDLYIKTLMESNLGLKLEDAREVGFGGCTETMIGGLSNVGSLEGYFNFAWMLQCALYDGHDPVTNEQAGPHTGKFEDFTSFDEFIAALKEQILYTTDGFVAVNRIALKNRFTKGDPKLYRTMFTRDCVKNRKSFEAGGARYNWTTVSYHGIANLIDSVYVIKKLVFEEKAVSSAELMQALKDDFNGCENLLKRISSLPKFGNDNLEVDAIGRELVGFAWEELRKHETPRGGRYIPSVILFTTYQSAGNQVAATPDGRKALTVLTDSAGAAQGRDITGPTALMNSVSGLPLSLAIGSPVLNIRFQRKMLDNDEGLAKAAAMIRAYFQAGGLQLQITVINTEDMKAAQCEPEKYRNLIVRVGGYSEYFNRLTRELQDSIIARSEHQCQ